ncbi:tRNA dihydrouridine(20/20a) synthase DusA [Crenothrix polyspora]|uniref:tRNA-dihydrouridine(20/20a) synthase n=1 Tax=Crenothrix polyspora TaxID=360316 RepID=A0A1R4H712_9GAMM|nr:tRNA dihydrouridine(20/20a) synthase DusA [Crenothrix polyspora]SJM91979.1 tRNA-dihydrouridine synthase A [Crenothrix polyspora]
MSSSKAKTVNRRFCVAPMMDWTDRHCRYFHRLISQHALLYTEMVTTGALIHGDNHRFLQFNTQEPPLALQLGGSNPQDLATCAKMAEDYGYDEVNLNVGCPSERVQNGRFGACLMLEPDLVAECVAAMQQAVGIPVTVKSRIGVDEQDSYEALVNFVATLTQAGCATFIIHARKAWLSGLSPKQNREVPPLRYDIVYQLKTDFPDAEIILNGGITTLEQAEAALQHVDGVMVGREAYHNPYIMADVDRRFYGAVREPLTREAILDLLIPYVQQQLQAGMRLNTVARHILGLFHGMPGGKLWRRQISENGCKFGADETVLYKPVILEH